MDVLQRDLVEIGRDLPAAAMALFGTDEAAFAQARHGAANDDRVRVHVGREFGRCHRLATLGHMQEHVEGNGEFAVGFHVTLYVT